MMLSIEKVVEDPDVVIWRHRGTTRRLVVCFSSVGADIDAPVGYELPGIATNQGQDEALFIADQTRSWLNGDGLTERIVAYVEKTARDIGAEQICTIGHSMGGFCASILPAFTHVDVALAFAPQASVHPEIAGDDFRWLKHRRRISSFRYRELADHISQDTQYFAIFGNVPRERPQRERFPTGKNIELMAVDEIGHNVSNRLKRLGLMPEIVQSAFQNRSADVKDILERRLTVETLSSASIEKPRSLLPPVAFTRDLATAV